VEVTDVDQNNFEFNEEEEVFIPPPKMNKGFKVNF
jgi:hypothetical protein